VPAESGVQDASGAASPQYREQYPQQEDEGLISINPVLRTVSKSARKLGYHLLGLIRQFYRAQCVPHYNYLSERKK
jgi:hypothetical protein